MQFKLVLDDEPQKPLPICVHLTLRKNLDGSVALVINNEAVGSPADLLTIGTDGVIRVSGYYSPSTEFSFIKYDESDTYPVKLYPRIVKI